MTTQVKQTETAAHIGAVPDVSKCARRELFRATRQLRAVFDQQLESVVRFHTPFFGNGLLVVVADQVTDLGAALSILCRTMPPWIKPICLRRSELFQLSLPNPNAFTTLSLSSWIREEGKILWGRDLRSSIPKNDTSGLLNYHLEFAAHHIRNRVILDALVRRDYPLLIHNLYEKRFELMISALLARGVWRVYPHTVTPGFLERYPAFHSNVSEFAELHAQRRDATRECAYRAAWLFELFVRGLRK